MKARVLIADDHALMRYGLRALLEANGAEVVGEAAEGREALRMALEAKPDIIIMDVTMPGMNGLEAAAALHSKCPRTRVIILSMHADSEHVHRAFAAGASAYLIKGSASEEVIAAVRAVQAGRRYLSRELESPERSREPLKGDAGPVASLSRRERQVLQLVVEGHSSSQIAAIVHISPTSVYTYRSRLMKKLGVADVTALVKFAVQHGLTPSS
jgi:DNA-binding NarL/FixJ family response regulator